MDLLILKTQTWPRCHALCELWLRAGNLLFWNEALECNICTSQFHWQADIVISKTSSSNQQIPGGNTTGQDIYEKEIRNAKIGKRNGLNLHSLAGQASKRSHCKHRATLNALHASGTISKRTGESSWLPKGLKWRLDLRRTCAHAHMRKTCMGRF